MEIAVVKIAGKQHLVKVGDTITVESPLGQDQKTMTFSDVLLLQLGDQLKIGTPLVGGAVVKTEVVATGKGEKIHILKFKAKSRYRKAMGFRPLITKLLVKSIESGQKEKESPAPKTEVKKAKVKK